MLAGLQYLNPLKARDMSAVNVRRWFSPNKLRRRTPKRRRHRQHETHKHNPTIPFDEVHRCLGYFNLYLQNRSNHTREVSHRLWLGVNWFLKNPVPVDSSRWGKNFLHLSVGKDFYHLLQVVRSYMFLYLFFSSQGVLLNDEVLIEMRYSGVAKNVLWGEHMVNLCKPWCSS